MANRTRNIVLRVPVTAEERAMIERKMQQMGTGCFSVYARKMLIDGYVIRLDYSDVKAMTAELQKIGTNINQIAKRVNATGTLYAQDIEDIKGAMAEIWQLQRSILSKAPYSQTRSNTQRDLLQPDEFLRLDKFKCIVMLNHYKPAELYKIMLEELPAYKELVKCSVFDYVPEWKRREDENKKRTPQKTASVPHETSAGHSSQAAVHFVPQENTSEKKQVPDREKACSRKPHAVAMPRQKSGEQCIYDFSDMKEGTSPEDIGLVEMTRSAVIGEDDSDLEELDDPSRIPPGRGI